MRINQQTGAHNDQLRRHRTMIGVLALACFVTGFIAAWVLRTGHVMTQISWAQERMERKVRYWQGEAVYARSVAEPALQQLAAYTAQAPEPTDWRQPVVGKN